MHPEPLNPAGDARVDTAADAPVPSGDPRVDTGADARADPSGDPRVDTGGDPRVDTAIAGLAAIDDMELADHPAVLEQVHDRLREILGELGDAGRPANGAQGHSGQGHAGPGHGATGDPRP